jgi:hypothetical protein
MGFKSSDISSLIPRAVTKGPRHHFFGYYDKCPWDSTGRYLLGLETEFMHRPPGPGDTATIGIVDLKNNNSWEPLEQTRAWNFQQGCMLQWLGTDPDDPKIIYNDLQDGHLVAVVLHIRSGKKLVHPRPIYAISNNGKFALSLNFPRLHHLRPGYGYVGVRDNSFGKLIPEDDGIYWMDLTSVENRLLISIKQIADIKPKENMYNAEHWFNHLSFCPDGSRFVFLHRWAKRNKDRALSPLMQSSDVKKLSRRIWRSIRRLIFKAEDSWVGTPVQFLKNNFWPLFPSFSTRMFTANSNGSDIYCLSSHGVVSHFDWLNDHQILAWAKEPNIGCRFFLFTDRSSRKEVIGERLLTNDGHCSYSPDKRWILTDTYPNPNDMITLILYDCDTCRRFNIGTFFSAPEIYGEIRCDLHPRWNHDGRQICFDSTHQGERQIYIMDVADIVERRILFGNYNA